MTHTPGPWIVGWSGDPGADGGKDAAGPITIVAEHAGQVAECYVIPTGHARTWEVVEANASLIAAAPRLRAALEQIHRVSLTGPFNERLLEIQRLASDALAQVDNRERREW